MACEELFRGIEEKKAGGDSHEFQVPVSLKSIHHTNCRCRYTNFLMNSKKVYTALLGYISQMQPQPHVQEIDLTPQTLLCTTT
jgi:hypothetical protein